MEHEHGGGAGGAKLPKWALPAAGALILLLLLRAKASGSAPAAAAKTSPAADPLQSAAQSLAIQNARQDANRQAALANLQTSFTGAEQQAAEAAKLGAKKIVACPNGAVLRLCPNPNSWTGLSYCCVTKNRSGGFVGSLLTVGLNYLTRGAGGGGLGRDPGVSGGSGGGKGGGKGGGNSGAGTGGGVPPWSTGDIA